LTSGHLRSPSVASAALASMTARPTETTSARGQTTLCRFRGALAERGLAEALFAELNRQLDTKGPVLKAGMLIDAAAERGRGLGPGSRRRLHAAWPAQLLRHRVPSRLGPRWGPVKAHVAVDLGSDLTRNAVDLCRCDLRSTFGLGRQPGCRWAAPRRRRGPREARFAGCHWLRCSWSRRQRPKGGTRPMTARPGARRWPVRRMRRTASSTASCIATMRAGHSPPGSAG